MELSKRFDGSAVLVGISGTLGAGKDTAANYFERLGFLHSSTGDVLRAEAKRQGRSTDRASLIEIAVEVRTEYGDVGALIFKAVELWQAKAAQYPRGLVLSGLRVVGECLTLKTQQGILVFVDAPAHMRYARLQARGRDSEAFRNFDDFTAYERTELLGVGDREKPNLRAIEAIADYKIINDRREVDLFSQLSHIYAEVINVDKN